MGSRSQRDDIILCPKVGENFVCGERRGRVLAGSRSGHILYLWTSSCSCLLSDHGVALAQECDPVKSCILLHPCE